MLGIVSVVRESISPTMKLNRYHTALLIVFVVTMPFVNPLVRGDGVGYYAYVRSMLVQHNLRFENDWINSSSPYINRQVDAEGRINDPYTKTGHLPNHYSIGPAMLWTPFLSIVHILMVLLQRAGLHVSADGFSLPYLLTGALATALYGFLGLWVSFTLARKFVADVWAFVATIGFWFASSLPVYMYFNPFYSHAHSVFAVAIFLWYWQRTRGHRTLTQWSILGLFAGLMLDVYYINIAVLLFPLLESLNQYRQTWQERPRLGNDLRNIFTGNLIFVMVATVAFLPTLIIRKIISGGALDFGYEPSSWTHPALWQPLLSSNHGLLSWTPIVIPALVGLYVLRRHDREFAAYSLSAFLAMYYIVACHPDWHGISSYGNRFFISLTPIFIPGLGVLLQDCGRWFKQTRTAIASFTIAIGLAILWNLAFIFQWGTGVIPHVGPISWRQMAYNQVTVVPAKLGGDLKSYFTHRKVMMKRIESEDLKRPPNN